MKTYLEDYGFKRLNKGFYGQLDSYFKQYDGFKLFVSESKDTVHAHLELGETEIDLPSRDIDWIVEFDKANNQELA